jgi:hypothetical protein
MVSNKSAAPKGFNEWAEWCCLHLDSIGDKVLPDHSFEDFCTAIAIKALAFQSTYQVEKNKRERTDHRKRDMTTLRNALKKARGQGCFSGKLTELLIHLLVKSCETECCYNYKKGTTPLVKCEVKFIAELANLLFKFTGKPFEYGSKSDPLCLVVVEIFRELGLPHDLGGIIYKIKNNILAVGIKNDSIRASRDFSLKELKCLDATPTTLPFGFSFSHARATFNTTVPEYEPHANFEHSDLAKEINNTPLPTLPEDLLHPDLCLWFRYITEKLCETGNDQARLLYKLAAEHLEDKDLSTLYTPESILCVIAQDAFKDRGALYSLQEVLGFIKSGIQMVMRNEKTGELLCVNAESIPGGGTSELIVDILELPNYVFERFEPRLVDFIPMACPSSLDDPGGLPE